MVESIKSKFLVSIPEEWINLKNYIINLDDVGEFYSNLLVVLKDMGTDVETTTVIKELIKTDKIFLSHHTNIDKKNVWNIKKGYLQDYLYFDRTGYSGWSEMANSEYLFNESQKIDYAAADKFFAEYSNNYISQRSTKIKQSNEKFHLNEPYVFVAGQRPHDTVAEWAHIPTLDLMKNVIKAFEDTEYRVVIKVHPLEKKKYQQKQGSYKFLWENPKIIVTDASIHDIIPNAAGVYTCNSGVGFESLLYLKRVFISGHCDYRWAATELYKADDIKRTAHLLEEPVHRGLIVKFMHYMLTEYFVNGKDLNSIRQKIEHTIREYNEI